MGKKRDQRGDRSSANARREIKGSREQLTSETSKSNRKAEISLSRILSQVSHPQMPHESLQHWSDMSFSLFTFIYLIDALWGQHIYMYKRYWWWPIDQKSSTLNLDLIDVRIPVFCVLTFLQSFIPLLIDTANEIYCARFGDFGTIDSVARHYKQYIKLLLAIGLLSGWFIGILVILCQLINDQEYVSVLMLCGPLLTKGVVFLLRTFEMVNKLKNQLGQNFSASYYEIYLASRQHVLSAENLKSTGETTDPRKIRQESNCFFTDFRRRVSSMLYPSMESAYYICFIPWWFLPKVMFVELNWLFVHAVLVIVNMLSFQCTQNFSPLYLHAAHKTSIQLGRWKRIELGTRSNDDISWKESDRYFKGRIVVHQSKRYKAAGKFINAGRPGNRHDSWFYSLFGPSFTVYKLMVFFQLTIVSAQLLLMHNAKWDRLVSLCLEQFCGYWNLFRIIRNGLTVRRAYKETSDQYGDPDEILARIFNTKGELDEKRRLDSS